MAGPIGNGLDFGPPPVDLPPIGKLPPMSPTDTRFPECVAALTVMIGIALITYILRIYSRLRTRGRLALDDYIITIGVVLSLADYALNIRYMTITRVRHIIYVKPADLQVALRLSYVSLMLSIWAITFIKVSVCILLLRIKNTRSWQWGIYTLIGILFCIAIIATTCQFLLCTPVRANWDIMMKLKAGNCLSTEKLRNVTYGFSSLFIATDVICALLPIVFLSQLTRPFREKCVVAFLMGLGLIASACGIVKLVMLVPALQTFDVVWDSAPLVIWTYAESYIGITAACIPCLKSLLEAAFKALGGHISSIKSSRKSHTDSSGSHNHSQDPKRDIEMAEKLGKPHKLSAYLDSCSEDEATPTEPRAIGRAY